MVVVNSKIKEVNKVLMLEDNYRWFWWEEEALAYDGLSKLEF